jgi:hypothetical protein
MPLFGQSGHTKTVPIRVLFFCYETKRGFEASVKKTPAAFLARRLKISVTGLSRFLFCDRNRKAIVYLSILSEEMHLKLSESRGKTIYLFC